ncbi:unnamed protein product [Pleuronectes platessa]|uniref:Uncharacterized protein n=1 Tax=Pleuronectes platessa TaxID=8262 RepID=A0A9N7TNU0_PLEPL|nr:unnamed protein product [Pleuronectes platessa]
MARLNWCLAAVISWGKFLFACFFPLRGAKRDKPGQVTFFHNNQAHLDSSSCMTFPSGGAWCSIMPLSSRLHLNHHMT